MHPSPGITTGDRAGVGVRPRPSAVQRVLGPDDPTQVGVERAPYIPAPANGLQLLGDYDHSGHRDAPSLVRRADGQVIQLTPLLYAVLASIDGSRRIDQIAAAVAERTGKVVADEDIRFLVEEKLRPLGVLRNVNGGEPQARRANPLLGLRLRLVVSNPDITRKIAAPFAKLFVPPVVLAVVVAFALVTTWLLFERGVGAAVRESLYQPGLLLLVFALTTLSAGFHELGHAAACVYGGGRPGVMGAGLYLAWPAFYTDVTDSYRLERRSRLRVDLGGIYFNAIFALLAFGLWATTGWEALLAVIPLQLLQMIRQLVPLVRLDGYHILADLTGVPDLFAHIKPILLGMLPTRWGRSESKRLKPWVRAVVTMWVVFVVPLLLFMFVLMVAVLPRIAATAWDSAGLQVRDVAAAWSNGDVAAAGVHLLSLAAIAVPLLGMVYLVTRVLRQLCMRVWRGTAGRPGRRAIAVLVAVGVVAALATAWWPKGQYTPIQADDRGRLTDFDMAAPPLLRNVLATVSVEEVPPTPDLPSADVDVRSIRGADNPGSAAPASLEDIRASAAETAPAFRFPLPDAPGEGDNQALAVNYTDRSSVVVMALDLVFGGEQAVTNSNEAYAVASCIKCVAAAIAFQLVIVLDEADVVVPENSAVAISAYCFKCVTYALAFQVVATLSGPLSDEARAKLDSLWARLESLQEKASRMALPELLSSLKTIEAEILGVLVEEEGASLNNGSSAAEEGADATPEASSSPSADPTPTTDSSATAEEPSSEPSPSPTAASPSPEPSPTPS